MAKARKIQKLKVYQESQDVGLLERAVNGAVSFQYSTQWLENKIAIPISLSLPLREQSYKGAEASFFFDNLLPDNPEIRSKIASRVEAESEKPFDLLSAIGHDCVGSLQFIPEGAALPKAVVKKGKVLKKSEIAKILNGLAFFPLGMQSEETDFRLSIAGAQEKTALLKVKDDWYKPSGATPSTHIFKPPMGILHNGIDLMTSVENEWLCMQICKELGLNVASCEMAKFEDRKCLIVERFDRKWLSPNRLARIPQEDMCQALGFPSSKKYQAEGGPGILKIMDFLNASDERAKDRSDFMRAQVIFFLLAATDGHAKNFSIFLTKSGFRLTPMYDVMTVFPAAKRRQIEIQKAKLAMSIAKRYKLSEILKRRIEEAAKEAGFSSKELLHIFEEMKEIVPALRDRIKFPKGFPEEMFDVTFKGMKKHLSRL